MCRRDQLVQSPCVGMEYFKYLGRISFVSLLNEALRSETPRIFSTDQGSQFTSTTFTQRLQDENISISMDGRGRAPDSALNKRLWRSLEYKDLYLHDYSDAVALRDGMTKYFEFYDRR